MRRLPVGGQQIGVVVRHDAVVGVDERAVRRIERRAAARRTGSSPCQSNSPVQPGTGQRPSPWPRIGTRPGAMKPMWPAVSAYSTFCIGAPLLPRGGDERRPVAGGAETEQRLDADVVLCERGPAQRQHLIALEHGARRRRGNRSDSTGPCRVSRTRKVSGSAPSTRMTSSRIANGAKPSGVRYCAGVVRIDPLDEQVLGVGAGVGEAPGDACRCGPARRPAGPACVAPISSRSGVLRWARYQGPGALQAQMRVVGEQRRAARGAAAVQHPGVRAQARRRRRRQHGGERIGRQRRARARPG